MTSTSIPMEENKEKVTVLRLILRDIAGVKVSTIWVKADAHISEYSHIPTVEMSNIIAFDRNLNNDDYQTEPNKEDFKNRVSSRFEAL